MGKQTMCFQKMEKYAAAGAAAYYSNWDERTTKVSVRKCIQIYANLSTGKSNSGWQWHKLLVRRLKTQCFLKNKNQEVKLHCNGIWLILSMIRKTFVYLLLTKM